MGSQLYRSDSDRMISGVSGGLAEYFDIDPVIVRLLWVVLCIFSGGLLLLVYTVMWIITPTYSDLYSEDHEEPVDPEDSEFDTSDDRDDSGIDDSESGGATEGVSTAAEGSATVVSARRSRMRFGRRHRGTGRAGPVIGTLLVVIGGIALLDSLNLFDFYNPWRLWPVYFDRVWSGDLPEATAQWPLVERNGGVSSSPVC